MVKRVLMNKKMMKLVGQHQVYQKKVDNQSIVIKQLRRTIAIQEGQIMTLNEQNESLEEELWSAQTTISDLEGEISTLNEFVQLRFCI